MKKRWFLLFLAFLCIISFAGCGASVSAPKVEDLKVSVEEQIKDGKRSVMFWFQNDSKFIVTYLQIHYKVKDDITKDDITAEFDYSYGLPEDWDVHNIFMDGIVGDQYQLETTKDEAIAVKPEETSPKTELHRNNIFFVEDIAEFENMVPDVMTIKYLDKDNSERTLYYNYNTKAYNEEENE